MAVVEVPWAVLRNTMLFTWNTRFCFKANASVGEPGFGSRLKINLEKNFEFCIFSLFMEPADFWSDKLMLECSVSSCGKTVAPALSPERMV